MIIKIFMLRKIFVCISNMGQINILFNMKIVMQGLAHNFMLQHFINCRSHVREFMFYFSFFYYFLLIHLIGRTKHRKNKFILDFINLSCLPNIKIKLMFGNGIWFILNFFLWVILIKICYKLLKLLIKF